MDSLQDLINSSKNPEVKDNRFKLNQMQKLTYEFVGGYIIYCEMFKLEIKISNLGDFDARVLIAKNGFDSATPRILETVTTDFISKASKAAIGAVIDQFDQHELMNHQGGNLTIPFGGFTCEGQFKFEALPEYAPGSSGKKAIDIFREKNGRDPTDNVIKTSKFTPAFGINGHY